MTLTWNLSVIKLIKRPSIEGLLIGIDSSNYRISIIKLTIP